MKIILSLATSLLITALLNRTVFFNGIPKVNVQKLKRDFKTVRDNIIILKNNLKYSLSKEKIDYDQLLSENQIVMEFELAPISPTLIPTQYLFPILTPTKEPFPTETIIPTPTEIILTTVNKISPTEKLKKLTPTKKIKPSPTLTKPSFPSQPPSAVVVINSPLSQPYYDPSLAYKCYTTEKFIEVYADNVKPNACYSNVKSIIEKNLTSISILGKSITIHKKAYPAFKAVSDELSKNTIAKNYKINTIGAYVFRCNVNASSGNPYDTCANGCVLSTHAFGISVDINWDENCNGCSSYTMPMEIVDIFEKYGFRWGGRYKSVFGSKIDSMHFEYLYDLCSFLNK